MTDNKSGSDQRDPKGDSASAPVAQKNEEHSAGDQPHGKSNPRERPESVRKKWTGYEWTTVVIQVVTGLALIAYTVFSYNMWQAMKESNEASRRSADNSEKSLVKSNDQFDLLRSDAAGAANEERGRFKEQLAASKDQAEASRKQSAADAAASLKVAREAMQRAERPVLNIERLTLTLNETDGSYVLQGVAKNIGRTAAFDPHFGCVVVGPHLPMDLYAEEFFTQITNVGPGQEFPFRCAFRGAKKAAIPEPMITVTAVYRDEFNTRLVNMNCFQSDAVGTLFSCLDRSEERRKEDSLFFWEPKGPQRIKPIPPG